MPLLNSQIEKRVKDLLQTVGNAFAVFSIGRDLGQSGFRAASSAAGFNTASRLTFLEQSFLAGKASRAIGTNALKKMTRAQILDWFNTNNIQLTDRDRAILASLRNETERWIEGRTGAWKNRIDAAIASADAEWRAVISNSSFQDGQSITLARNAALRNLVDRLDDSQSGMQSDVDRIIQSEMHRWFQQGAVADVDGEELVYKIPRYSACRWCLSLHTEPDGSPKIYKLSEVAGNSNFGLPAYAWKFVIGPVHPYCYCILHRVSDQTPKKKDKKLANARRETLRKSIEMQSSTECGPIQMNVLYEEQLIGYQAGEEPPEYELSLVETVRELYES